MTLLVYTTLFPNAAEPHHGVFVRERLRLYREAHPCDVAVVAPTPWAPPFGGPPHWQRYRDVPKRERWGDVDVEHPRYASPPGFGDEWRGRLMARGSKRTTLRVARALQPRVLDAHYAYPDGVAAARLRPALSKALGRRLPLVITCRGTDLNLFPQQPAVRSQLVEALGAADHVVCVADALRDVALELGVDPERVTTLRNGVDIERFTPGDRGAARREVGLPDDRRVVVCVGHLCERKGQRYLVEAYARAFDGVARGQRPRLVLVGQGEDKELLEQLVAKHGLADDVHMPGAIEPAALPPWYRAADAMVLASSREGWPNVVLEALASGTPVIATRVWGTPEILTGCAAGLLVDATVEGLREGLERLDELDSSAARPWAEKHTWDSTVAGMQRVFEKVSA